MVKEGDMAEEVTTECELCRVEVLNPEVHDRWHRGKAESAAPASSSSPPSWWRHWAAAHDLEQARKRGQRNLL